MASRLCCMAPCCRGLTSGGNWKNVEEAAIYGRGSDKRAQVERFCDLMIYFFRAADAEYGERIAIAVAQLREE